MIAMVDIIRWPTYFFKRYTHNYIDYLHSKVIHRPANFRHSLLTGCCCGTLIILIKIRNSTAHVHPSVHATYYLSALPFNCSLAFKQPSLSKSFLSSNANEHCSFPTLKFWFFYKTLALCELKLTFRPNSQGLQRKKNFSRACNAQHSTRTTSRKLF